MTKISQDQISEYILFQFEGLITTLNIAHQTKLASELSTIVENFQNENPAIKVNKTTTIKKTVE